MFQQPQMDGNEVQLSPYQPPVEVVTGNGYQVPNNPQPQNPNAQVQPQYNDVPSYDELPGEEYRPEPPLQTGGSYAVHREGEYDNYPDFPGYPNNDNPMFNHQNV